MTQLRVYRVWGIEIYGLKGLAMGTNEGLGFCSFKRLLGKLMITLKKPAPSGHLGARPRFLAEAISNPKLGHPQILGLQVPNAIIWTGFWT